MRYFTAAWALGDMDEDDASAVIPRYNSDLALAFDVDDPVRLFAEQVGLNDAYVDRALWDEAAGTLSLLLLTGSLQVGYWRTELTYSGVSAIEGRRVLRSALTTRPTEIWYDEFFRDGGSIVHAVLFVPHGSSDESPDEFAVRFSSFRYRQTAAPERALLTKTDQSIWRNQ